MTYNNYDKMNYKDEEHFKNATGYDIKDLGWVPRVTSIVGIKAKPALYRFYASLSSFNEGEKIKEISAAEGTLVHETIQNILIGKAMDIDPNIKPAIEAALKFIEEKNIQILPEFIEKRVINKKELYAGTIDALAIIDGKLGVLDIKTSQSIYRDYDLQTSAYVATLKDAIKNLESRWILRIDQHRICQKCGAIQRTKGGREKIILPWNRDNIGVRIKATKCDHKWSPLFGDIELKESTKWEKDYSAFLAAKKLWEWENEYWLNKIKYVKK